MNEKNILIVESGSTKTDWCLLKSGKTKMYFTQGINPLLLNDEQIVEIFQNELKLNPAKIKMDEIYFYGAGVHNELNKKRIKNNQNTKVNNKSN